jgi:hypothetical protein
MAENNEAVSVPLFIEGAEDVPILFANLMLAQHQQNEFILTFCQYAPPPILGSAEDQIEQVRNMPYVPVKVVARIGLTPDRLAELMQVLDANYKAWKLTKQQDNGG